MDRYSDYLWNYGLYWYPFVLITPGICIWSSICLRWIDKYKGLRWIKRMLETVGSNSFEVYLIHIPIFEYAHKFIEHYEIREYRNHILIGAVFATILGCIILKMIVKGVLKVYKKGIK